VGGRVQALQCAGHTASSNEHPTSETAAAHPGVSGP
jgi:hypothetical protein